jgi:hypothetical protein
MSVLTEFRRVAREFVSETDDTVNDLTDTVSLGLDAETFGVRMDEACARLVAHELTLIRRAEGGVDAPGPTTSVKTGDLAASFAAPASTPSDGDAYYRTTRHGLAFLTIRNSRSDIGFGILC